MSQSAKLRAALGALVAAPLVAQADAGPVLASQIAGIIRPGTRSSAGPLPPRQLYEKKAGFQAVAASAAGAPDFRFRAMFPDPSQPDGAAHIQVDALSIGQDLIHADSTGKLAPSADLWSALVFGVEQASLGASATGVIAAEAARPDGAGADVFSWAYGRLPPELLRVTQRAVDSEELDLFGGGVQGELISLDVNLAAYLLDGAIVAELDPTPSVYFSVNNLSRPAVPSGWWAGSMPSGATIFCIHWDGSAWSTPQPAIRFDDLGLVRSDDVDALAIEFTGSSVDVVFSTAALSMHAPSQLMFIRLAGIGCAGSATELKDDDDMPVAGKVGSGDGNLDTICFYDPSFLQGGPPTNIEAFITGTPLSTLRVGGTPRALEASAWRGCVGPLATSASFMTGWPGGAAGADAVIHVVGIGVLGSPPSSYHLIASFTRTGLEDAGGPLASHLPLPPGFPLTGTLYLEHVWLGQRTSDGQLGQSFPVKIRI